MKTSAEQRWERMQELLAREATGSDRPIKISSQRTLFGIKSHVEEVIERTAAEEDARCRGAMRSQELSKADGEQDPSAVERAEGADALE